MREEKYIMAVRQGHFFLCAALLSSEDVPEVEPAEVPDCSSGAEGRVGPVGALPVKDHPGVDIALERSASDVDAGRGHRVDVLPVELPGDAEGGCHAVPIVAHLRLQPDLGHELVGVGVEGARDGGHEGDLVVALGDVLAGEQERADAAGASDQVGRVVGVEAAQEPVLCRWFGYSEEEDGGEGREKEEDMWSGQQKSTGWGAEEGEGAVLRRSLPLVGHLSNIQNARLLSELQ